MGHKVLAIAGLLVAVAMPVSAAGSGTEAEGIDADLLVTSTNSAEDCVAAGRYQGNNAVGVGGYDEGNYTGVYVYMTWPLSVGVWVAYNQPECEETV